VKYGRTIANKSDFITGNNKKGRCLVTRCIFRRQKCDQEKNREFLVYKDHRIETQRMRNIKAIAIPLITGKTGTISKSFRPYPSNVQEKH
jgi:hypothetical protein